MWLGSISSSSAPWTTCWRAATARPRRRRWRVPVLSALAAGRLLADATNPPPEQSIPIGEHWLQLTPFGGGLMTINADTIILTWVVIGLIVIPLLIWGRNFTSGVPNAFQAVYEYVVEFVNEQAEQGLGDRAATIMPLALTIF